MIKILNKHKLLSLIKKGNCFGLIYSGEIHGNIRKKAT
jgi:hypothetical protein